MPDSGMRSAPSSPASPEAAMLDKVHRDLVQIHMAAASRTNSDPEIRSWTVNELMGVIREIEAFRQTQRDRASTAVSS
jgi:hypothetical protein